MQKLMEVVMEVAAMAFVEGRRLRRRGKTSAMVGEFAGGKTSAMVGEFAVSVRKKLFWCASYVIK